MSPSLSVLPTVDARLNTDRAPPPPYSETDPSDTFSNSARGTSNDRLLTPLSSSTGTTSVPPRAFQSTASSAEETVYTPPPSSADSVFQDRALVDHHVSASAAAFFESRPATTQVIASRTIIKIAVDLDTQNVPYTAEMLLARDVTDQDWATFVNYLLPDRAFKVNNDVADRKLMNEQMHLLTLTEDNTTSDISHLDAQLKPLRQHQPQHAHNPDKKRQLDMVISEWNECFFEPRGLQIQMEYMPKDLAPVDDTREIDDQQHRSTPGAWIPYDHELLGESSTARSRKGIFSGFRGFQSNSQSGFRVGPIVAGNEGFRIGKAALVADGSGFRVGNMIVADQHGIRFGGSRGPVADSNGASMTGKSVGRHEQRDIEDVRGQREHWRHRGQSFSSSSSASSLDSEESGSSIGSIQDYDDLGDQQLPIAKQALTRWLDCADQHITKDSVANMRREIASVSGGPLRHTTPNVALLRREVKELMKEFKESKKAQMKERRQAKRQQRAIRRAHRIERRNAKREARRARRKGKGTRTMAESRQPTWMSSRSSIELSQEDSVPPILPPRPATGASARLPFARTASVPILECTRSKNFSDHDAARGPALPALPGSSAMHGGWPYSRGMPYSPGNISVPHLLSGAFPGPISDAAGQLYVQAQKLETSANSKENRAIELRTEATGRRMEETEKLKKLSEATTLEEEAEQVRMEAGRLRAEGLHLDSELARELEEQHGQVTGTVRN